MHLKSTTTKALATLTAAGILTFGGATAAFAADGGPGGSGRGATIAREHPGAFRGAVKAAFAAAADTLGLSAQELRAAVLEGPQSVAAVAGDRAPEVTAAVEAALGGQIDTAEANGSITAERAAKLRERIPTAAERFMNKVPTGRGA